MSYEKVLLFFYKSGDMKTYLIRFIFSIILTSVPFWIVMNNAVSHDIIVWIIISMAIVQIIMHLIYLLHINIYLNDSLNLFTFLFTIIIISIIVIGSLSIMYSLNVNMVVD
ncbi:MAG: cytochrome o ubiquinol oxidase subunit IV [Arsenophonus sp.]